MTGSMKLIKRAIALLLLDKGCVFLIQFISAAFISFISLKFIYSEINPNSDLSKIISSSSNIIIGLFLFQILNQSAIIARLCSLQSGEKLTVVESYNIAFKRSLVYAFAFIITIVFLSFMILLPTTILSLFIKSKELVSTMVGFIGLVSYIVVTMFVGILIVFKNKNIAEALKENIRIIYNHISIKTIFLLFILQFTPFALVMVFNIKANIIMYLFSSSAFLLGMGLKVIIFNMAEEKYNKVDKEEILIV